MASPSDSLFSLHEHALERELETCPKCQSKLQIRSSKSGPFLGCSGYPKCDYSRPLVQHQNIDTQVIDDSSCPDCGKPLAVKSGRYGIFIGCTGYPQCSFHENPNAAPEPNEVTCPQCRKGELAARTNKYGKSFYGCSNYPKCKYVLNYKPVAQACAQCGWPVLVERKMAAGLSLVCPQKTCRFKMLKPSQ
ncbi:DNA topoisomerase family protein [Paraferrimonas haliotis]|uniref:DNA topoisomerase type IA zn finger domain-containing protein n=1 Tax=Paraferrimonas haliotis TaxID=2013866 RepID=A0AA37WZD7_9GAMM|nr:type I DNA topoisomerase [Paraferrimonas haliotis]GLS84830.1 hypothetical protein GCM10007894_28070 [Paraferrimonas haliotis]